MFYLRNIKKWQFYTLIIVALVPLIITSIELIFSEGSSVIFLGNLHPNLSTILIIYYVFLLGLGIYWFVVQLVAIANLKKEQAVSELMLLRSQVNPHFFFNMLNNLYGLVASDKKKAQELILKLSDVMRYSIYKGEKMQVELQEEIGYMKNYIELHKMRYHKKIIVEFDIKVSEKYTVAPLLFIMILENAFKHGVESLRSGAYVTVFLEADAHSIRFNVKNNYSSELKEAGGGIGLKNLKRRLELVYPGKHMLETVQTEDVFNSKLTLMHV